MVCVWLDVKPITDLDVLQYYNWVLVIKAILSASVNSLVGLLVGRFIAELAGSERVTFFDYVGRRELLRKVPPDSFWSQLLGCPTCLGFWARLPWLLVTSLVLLRSEPVRVRVVLTVGAVLAAYEADRQITKKEFQTAERDEKGRLY